MFLFERKLEGTFSSSHVTSGLDWWAEVTHGAKNGGSFSEMMGPSISIYPSVKVPSISMENDGVLERAKMGISINGEKE